METPFNWSGAMGKVLMGMGVLVGESRTVGVGLAAAPGPAAAPEPGRRVPSTRFWRNSVMIPQPEEERTSREAMARLTSCRKTLWEALGRKRVVGRMPV
jgi:hypothetical protein